MLPGSYDLPGARPARPGRGDGPAALAGRLPLGRGADPRVAGDLPLEETYETLEAIETGDRDHLREELGDLLLQVVFHARIAAEDPDEPWSVDDVAGDIVDKLVRRHPHVFGDRRTRRRRRPTSRPAGSAQKAAEKGRASAVDGVPMALPALSLAAKLVHRAERNGVDVDPVDGDGLGARLLRLVAEARAAGLDAEAELRARGPPLRRRGCAPPRQATAGPQPPG